ncbi:hypothetical protein [Castellaniella sp.]|nr:hypothetical protein [Castellaniella sp.]
MDRQQVEAVVLKIISAVLKESVGPGRVARRIGEVGLSQTYRDHVRA